MTEPTHDCHLEARLCFGAYRLNRAFNRFYQRAFAETGLTYPKYVILLALSEQGPLSVTELSARAGVEPNTLSPLLKKMAGFGVVERQRLVEDERRVQISLTDFGRTVLAKANAVIDTGFADLKLDPATVRQIVDQCDAVIARLDAADPPRLSLDQPD